MGNIEINLDPPERSGGVVEIRGGGLRSGAVAIVVGLVIVVGLAVAVGRSRDKGKADIAEPTSTTLISATSTTTDTSSTSTSLPRTTTTASAVQVFGPLLPEKTGVTLVVTQSNGHIVQVDVDTGTVTDLLPGQTLRNSYQLVVLRHGVVVTGDTGPRFIADGKSSILQGGVDGLIGTPDGIHVLGLSYGETGPRLVSIVPGSPPGAPIDLPADADALALLPGAVVLQSRAGGVYQFDLASGQVHKIAEGAFVAATGNRVASATCDDALQCGIGVGPFGGRPAHQVAVEAGLIGGGFYYGGGAALSPTRDLLAYAASVGGAAPTVSVLDLDTGDVVLRGGSVSPGSGVVQFVWSTDGRWLFWAADGHVKAWSPERGGDPIEFANAEGSLGAAEMLASGY